MLTLKYIPVQLTKKQLMVLMCHKVEELLIDGSKGSGKTIACVADALQHADIPNERCIFIRNNHKDMIKPGGMLDVMKNWMKNYPEVQFKEGRYFKFPSGAEYHFGHLGDEGSQNYIQGTEWTGIYYDETVYLKPNFIDDVNACLRTSGTYPATLRIRYATNPANTPMGILLKKRFVKGKPTKHTFRIPMFTEENEYLHDVHAYKRRVAAISDPVRRAQLLDGDWDATPESGFFYTQNIRYIDAPFEDSPVLTVRGWDMGTTHGKGDYSVGARMSLYYRDIEIDGEMKKRDVYVIEDIIRGQWSPKEFAYHLKKTAEQDGTSVPIIIESEIGASGEILIQNLRETTLFGYQVISAKIQDSKISRAAGLSIAMADGTVFMVKAPWNTSCVDELISFPTPNVHDDQVDALAHDFQVLSKVLTHLE